MISSSNLLMFYLGLELSTIPFAALCNFDLEKRRSSEAAMKMIISSAFSSGLLLFGISLLYGSTGTLSFTELTTHLMEIHCKYLLSFYYLPVSGLKFLQFHFICGRRMCMKVPGCCYFLFIGYLKGRHFVCNGFSFLQCFSPIANSWYNMIFLISVATMVIGNLFALASKEYETISCFFIHCTNWFYFSWSQRHNQCRNFFCYLFYFDLYFFQSWCIWRDIAGKCHYRKRKYG